VEIGWFIYTVIVIMIAMAACAAAVVMWVLAERRQDLVAAAGFAVYVLEVAVIFYAEYAGSKPHAQEFFDYGLSYPAYTLTLSVMLVSLIWVWLRMRAHRSVTARQVALFVAAFGITSFVLLPVEGNAGMVRTVVFWEFRDFVIIGSMLDAYRWYRSEAPENARLDLRRSKTTFVVALVLACAMAFEDYLTIMVIQDAPAGSPEAEFQWHLTERNLSENVLMMWCALRFIRDTRLNVGVFGRHPDTASTSGGDDRRRTEGIEAKAPVFGEHYGLSRRETEVLALVIQGLNTNEIASRLTISPGTVKAHLHRIYSKCGVSSREMLTSKFWRS
jgi:DNA-binding CsgD family transcriptional regulator